MFLIRGVLVTKVVPENLAVSVREACSANLMRTQPKCDFHATVRRKIRWLAQKLHLLANFGDASSEAFEWPCTCNRPNCVASPAALKHATTELFIAVTKSLWGLQLQSIALYIAIDC
jgi:hypothetical protein